MILARNTVFEYDDNERYRVLSSDKGNNGVWVISLSDEKALPVFVGRSTLINWKVEKVVKIVNDENAARLLSDEEITEVQREHRENAWSWIKEIIGCEPDIYTKKGRAKLIRDIEKKFNITRQTIYKLLRRYWQYGQVPQALIPLFNNCGGPGKAKKASNIKRGRQREKSKGKGVNVTEEMLLQMKLAWSKEFFGNRKATMR